MGKASAKAVLLGYVTLALMAGAPAWADLKGPAELPPKEFKGQQYVDSKGCVFLRGGFGNQITWVPRITADRSQMCGYPPSGKRVEVASAAESAPPKKPSAAPNAGQFVTTSPIKNPANPSPIVVFAPPQAQVQAQAKPSPNPSSATAARPASAPPSASTVSALNQSAKAASTAPQRPVVLPAQGAAAPSTAKVICPPSAPVPKAFSLQGGGSQVFCTTDGQSLAQAVPPNGPIGQGANSASPARQSQTAGSQGRSSPNASPLPLAPAGAVAMPEGYVPVWKDDRLNPLRGPRSAQGDEMMAQIWTNRLPATERKDVVIAQDYQRQTALEAAASPSYQGAQTGSYRVQIGSFAVPANADRVVGRLQKMGYPAMRAWAKGGKLQVIYAGPFNGGAEAQAALSQLRSSGYSDAVLKR